MTRKFFHEIKKLIMVTPKECGMGKDQIPGLEGEKTPEHLVINTTRPEPHHLSICPVNEIPPDSMVHLGRS
ncbi:MAG: hypothetical protein ABIC96_01495 [Patescibacteria group bacterium]